MGAIVIDDAINTIREGLLTQGINVSSLEGLEKYIERRVTTMALNRDVVDMNNYRAVTSQLGDKVANIMGDKKGLVEQAIDNTVSSQVEGLKAVRQTTR